MGGWESGARTLRGAEPRRSSRGLLALEAWFRWQSPICYLNIFLICDVFRWIIGRGYVGVLVDLEGHGSDIYIHTLTTFVIGWVLLSRVMKYLLG